MKVFRICFTILLALLIHSVAFSQQLQQGTIRGTVTDESGVPLPGVNITVKGPSLIGIVTDITKDNGQFRAPGLPPGLYTVTFELPGFQTILQEGLIINVGKIATVTIQMTQATIDEQITVVAPSPVVDTQTNKLISTINQDALMNLPLSRSISSVIKLTAGAVGTQMHAGTGISNTYEIDGLMSNDADLNDRGPTIEFDAMQEVQIVTGGLPAQVGNTGGAFVNVVSKSGGNKFSGRVQMYYTQDGLNNVLFSDEDMDALNVGQPTFDILNLQSVVTLGGPIMKDKLWFFGNGRYHYRKYYSSFLPTTILGEEYTQYQPIRKEWNGFLKITGLLAQNLRFFVMGNYGRPYRNFQGAGTYKTWSSTQERWDWNADFTANLSWTISPNTILDLRAGTVDVHFDLEYQAGTEDSYQYRDYYTGYRWGAPGRGEFVWRATRQATWRLTHFQDDLFGGDHEFRAGMDFYRGISDWKWWLFVPARINYYNGNVYYYRGLYGLDEAHPTYGDGRINMYPVGPKDNYNDVNGTENRFSFFVQDSFTIGTRLTLNYGVRYDSWVGWIPGSTKVGSDAPIEAIGAAVFTDTLGFNPYGPMTVERWDDVINWDKISPRIGLSFDPTGQGKTAIKASYSRYVEPFPVAQFQTLHPFRPTGFSFRWWDLNGNGTIDVPPIDRYEHYGSSPLAFLPEYYTKRIEPGTTSPIHDEITVSINHELFRDLNVGIQYIYKNITDAVGAVLYDSISERYWYTAEQATDWWIPFTTIVPAVGDFPDEEVTMYFKSNDAPPEITRFTNVPESKKKFNALEFTFDKRMSNGWQLGGSVVVSKILSDRGDSRGSVWGFSSAFRQANWWVNQYGRQGMDRPLVIKLYGTFNLPWQFLASFYFSHFSGSPWQRTVSVVPPSAWRAANNASSNSYSINVETAGARRNNDIDNVDFRLEKEFTLGTVGRLGVYVDIYNLLGTKNLSVGRNPGGTWRPTAENTNVGTYSTTGSYGRVTGLSGVRNFQLSFRFSF